MTEKRSTSQRGCQSWWFDRCLTFSHIAEPVFSYLALSYHVMYYLALMYGHRVTKASQPTGTHTVKIWILFSLTPYQLQLGTVFSLGIKVFAHNHVSYFPIHL